MARVVQEKDNLREIQIDNMKAVAIPYIIAIILGIMIIVLVGYWFVAQGGKSVATGQSAECNALIFNRCNGFAEWNADASKTCNGMSDPKGTAKCGTSSTQGNTQVPPRPKSGACQGVQQNECGNNEFQDCVNGFWTSCRRE